MKRKIIIFLMFLTVLVIVSGYCGFRLLRHEQKQKMQISQLQGRVAEIFERFKRFSNDNIYDISWNENNYNWLALGNSLTLIPAWGRGICSTQPDNDYFGLVKKWLNNSYKKEVIANRYNYSVWERSSERNNVLDLIDIFLSPAIDLVTIQLGENVADISTYEDDLLSLVEYVQAKAPKAQIIIIDDFWNEEKSNIRKNVAKKKNLNFADLSSIRGKQAYQSKEGIICYLSDGNTIKVKAIEETHPGDEGFKIISEKVIEEIKKLRK